MKQTSAKHKVANGKGTRGPGTHTSTTGKETKGAWDTKTTQQLQKK